MNQLISEHFWDIMAVLITVAVIILIGWILTAVNRHFFKRLEKKQRALHHKFFERFLHGLILIGMLLLAISSFGGFDTVWQTVLGGTAIISAVIAFAAQDAIKDILAGLMISIYKPFDIGNRIELDNGVAGIVEDMTMRHVVIVRIDTIREVIPNSRINDMIVTNFSYRSKLKAVAFRFSVGYGSDIRLARDVIAKAIEQSPYSIAGKTVDGEQKYAPVYFIDFADSALILHATVYYDSKTTTEVIKDDINTRVRDTLNQNGIEIPYNYITVVSGDKS